MDKLTNAAFVEEAPKKLAHYTGCVDAVEQILRSGDIWATECMSATGGEGDLKVATGTILSVLAELEAKNSRSRTAHSLAHSCKVVRENYNEWQIAKRAKIYVACLTPVVDNAAMWKEKFGGHGYGASIEFRLLGDEGLSFDDRGWGRYKVEYDLRVLRGAIKAEMTKVLDVARAYPRCAERDGVVSSGLFRIAAIAATLAKGKEASFQNEWRIAIVPGRDERGNPINIETQQPDQKPRTNLSLRANSHDLPTVTRIVLGPNNLPEKLDEVREQLRGLGYGTERSDMPDVTISACPRVDPGPGT